RLASSPPDDPGRKTPGGRGLLPSAPRQESGTIEASPPPSHCDCSNWRRRSPSVSIARDRKRDDNANKPTRKWREMTAIAEQGGIFTINARQWLILLMVQLANMLFGMTITLANLVLPQMRGNLSATQEEISWVITLNLVATAVATPMTGWLSSR